MITLTVEITHRPASRSEVNVKQCRIWNGAVDCAVNKSATFPASALAEGCLALNIIDLLENYLKAIDINQK